MRYNAKPDEFPEFGRQPFPFFCDVFDAIGAEVPSVIACDTETGEVVGHVLSPSGSFVMLEDGTGAAKYRATVTPPLRLVQVETDTPLLIRSR